MDKKEKLAQMRALIEKQETNNENDSSDRGPSPVYPFFNMDVESQCVIRLLPDGNDDNILFWVENQMVWLDFPGIKGGMPEKVSFRVPCAEMFGLQCPILTHIRKEKWFDMGPDMEALGRKYWKKRTWIYQGFVVEDGLGEDNPPENPIRRFNMGKQIHDIIKTSMADSELDAPVDDYDEGIDFVIRKTKQGDGNNSYTTSGFKRKPRSLSDEEREAIEQYGLTDLSEFKAKKPTEEELKAIEEMFFASLEGEFYDPDRWGYLPWRPHGLNTSTPSTPKAESDEEKTSAPTQVVEEKTEEAPKPTKSGKSASDILAQLKNQ